MHELGPFLETELLETALDEILDRLHVVIRGLLDLLHLCGLLRSQVLINLAHCREERIVHIGELRQRNPAQSDVILDFHTDPVTDQRIFTEIRPESLCLGCISSVDRRDCQ